MIIIHLESQLAWIFRRKMKDIWWSVKVRPNAMPNKGWHYIEAMFSSNLESFDTDVVKRSARTADSDARIQALFANLQRKQYLLLFFFQVLTSNIFFYLD